MNIRKILAFPFAAPGALLLAIGLVIRHGSDKATRMIEASGAAAKAVKEQE